MYEYREDSGHRETLEAATLEDAIAEAEDLLRTGSWGQDAPGYAGDTVQAHLYADGDYVRSVEVDLPACEPPCIDGEGHDMTSEGCGGCAENPGVMGHGGTAISVTTRCTRCGRTRTEYHAGSQRNPGEARVSVQWSEA